MKVHPETLLYETSVTASRSADKPGRPDPAGGVTKSTWRTDFTPVPARVAQTGTFLATSGGLARGGARVCRSAIIGDFQLQAEHSMDSSHSR
ncbi:MAG: hypothetical protein AB9M53_03525 [Leptothrix sp. (in: b-proteobacteria)]